MNALLLLSLSLATGPVPQSPKPIQFPQPVNVCEVVTKPDVEHALGRHMLTEQGVGTESRLARECDYQAAGGQVTIRLEHSSAALDPKVEF